MLRLSLIQPQAKRSITGNLSKIWTKCMANDLGKLSQGVGQQFSGSNTIAWIRHDAVPKNRTVTYAHIVCDLRPQKDEVKRTHVTVGGNLIDYPGEVSTDTAGLTTAKLVMNSTISTKGARYMGLDINNFYLNTPINQYKYMQFPLWMLPEESKNNTISWTLSITDTSTPKFVKVCTDYHKRVSWPTSCLSRALPPIGTHQHGTCLGSGHTKPDPSYFCSLWMLLGSSMLGGSMLTILFTPYSYTTSCLPVGQAYDTVV
jgi:hypothetical protein